MLSIAVGSTVALILTGLLVKATNSGSPELHRQSSRVMMTAVQIVCGDCAGDGERPIRTCLDQSARCEQCGGTSYVLASELAAHSVRLRAARVKAGGRVLNFEAPLSSRGRVVARVAV
jgi:hypothetical protein